MQMSEPALRDATYEDLLQVPDHLVAELIDRELFTSPRPASPHALASSVLGAKLLSSFHYGGAAMYSSPTSPDGVEHGCRFSPKSRGST